MEIKIPLEVGPPKCPHGAPMPDDINPPWSNLEVGIGCWWCLASEIAAIKRGLGNAGIATIKITGEP
jgi:hypothetical protein